MRVASLQFHVLPGEVESNKQRAEELIRQAKAKGAEFVLLPELWNCGFKWDELKNMAENLKNSPTLLFMQELASQLGIYIWAGSICEVKDGKYYNTAVAIGKNGEILQKYRKAHLFRIGLQEHLHFEAGNEWAFVDLPEVKIGMAICYDLRFPEFTRNLALRGAKLITFPAQWPLNRIREMRPLIKARAIENQCFIVTCNVTGHDNVNDLSYSGSSMIVSPFGEVLADGGVKEGVVIADLDFDLIPKAAKMDVLGERRRILDEIDDNML